ncbi:MAG: ATP-binding protein [Alphaproteobacteria bacterium]
MALATVTENPDEKGETAAASPGDKGLARRFAGPLPAGSKLGRLIILLNLVGLAILIAGALVLNELRRGLIQARIDGLTTQGQFIVKVLDETATVGDPAPALKAQQASEFLQILFIPRGQRARLFDSAGQLVADSEAVADRVEARALARARAPGEKPLPLMIRKDHDPRALASAQAGLAVELKAALAGHPVAGVRFTETGDRVVSVSMPIQHVAAVLGVLTLEADDVDKIVAAQRAALVPFILIAITATLTSSLMLNRLVARPVLRLARAADRVRLAGEREMSLPDIARRDDELGDLARALADMTHAQSERMDATERFAADVAHEIRNPLTSIRSAVETLDLVTDPAVINRLLGIIKQDAGRLDRLITDISNASRIDAELSRDPPEPIDVERLLTEIANLYEAQVKPGSGPLGVHVRYTGDRTLRMVVPAVVMARENPLGQVLRNLIDNARSFSPPGGTVSLSATSAKGRVVIYVDDEGPGVPPDNLETVFERFYTARPKGQAFGGNSGLGLSIARQIITAYGGEVRAESRLNPDGSVAGARFLIDLPDAPHGVGH